jgi:hypothetical protein
MIIRQVSKQQMGPTQTDLEPTYTIRLEITEAESDAVTNNTERATCWRLLQEAIAAWEAAQ